MEEQDRFSQIEVHRLLYYYFEIPTIFDLSPKRNGFYDFLKPEFLISTSELVLGGAEQSIRPTDQQYLKVLGPCQHPQSRSHEAWLEWSEVENSSPSQGNAEGVASLGIGMRMVWMVAGLVVVGSFMCYL